VVVAGRVVVEGLAVVVVIVGDVVVKVKGLVVAGIVVTAFAEVVGIVVMGIYVSKTNVVTSGNGAGS
jgi:hypothetical protein